MVQLKNAILKFGSVNPQALAPDCVTGDWVSWSVSFGLAPPLFTVPPRVVVTATTAPAAHTAAAVGMTEGVNTGGFTLWGRNSDCAAGSAGFNWMAIQETPGVDQRIQEDIRMGVLYPKFFSSDCTQGDWKSWNVLFSQPQLGSPQSLPTVLLTARNLFISEGMIRHPAPPEEFVPLLPTNHNTATVGLVDSPSVTGFRLTARNSDCAIGYCNFNYVAIAGARPGLAGIPGAEQLLVDSGTVDQEEFAPDCTEGDWKFSDIFFVRPFLTPPVVLVTGTVTPLNRAAPVCIAQYVTPNGFRLAARNSDCDSGFAGFHWIALGCQPGCG